MRLQKAIAQNFSLIVEELPIEDLRSAALDAHAIAAGAPPTGNILASLGRDCSIRYCVDPSKGADIAARCVERRMSRIAMDLTMPTQIHPDEHPATLAVKRALNSAELMGLARVTTFLKADIAAITQMPSSKRVEAAYVALRAPEKSVAAFANTGFFNALARHIEYLEGHRANSLFEDGSALEPTSSESAPAMLSN
jgi:hypothetical protein